MQKSVLPETPGRLAAVPEATFSIVLALSFAHLLNDMMQSLLPAIYPLIKDAYGLDFGQIGLITLAFQLTASLLQPVVGMYTDRRPQPFSLVAGMGCTFVGLIVLAHAGSYAMLLIGAALIGTGSSIFHPEVDAHGAHGLGRPPRLRPVAVPGRRAGGTVARAAARGLHRRAARTGEHLLVLAGGAAGDGAAAAGRAVVQAPVAGPREGAHGRRRGRHAVAGGERHFGARHPRAC